MTFKFIKISHNLFFIIFLNFCVFQARPLRASKIPTIKVLILKDNKIRIRADRSIPFTVEGQRFLNKKFKGLTLKIENNRKIMFFDKNKQKIYDLNNKEKFLVRTSDSRGIWVGQKRYAGKLNIFIGDKNISVVNIIGVENYLSSVVDVVLGLSSSLINLNLTNVLLRFIFLRISNPEN